MILAATAFAGAPAFAQDAETPDELVLGLVPSREADVLVENAKPLAEYLSQELGIPVKEFVPVDYPGLVVAMQTGQAHIGAFGPVGMVLAAREAGADLLLQSVRRGSTTYYSQWMTNNADKYCADSPVADEDGRFFCNGTLDSDERPFGAEFIALVGEESRAGTGDPTTVSFVTPTSASGFTFPSVQLELAGVDRDTDINSVFAGGHDNSVIALCNGDAEVGLSFNDARGILQEGDCDNMDEIVVFAFSQRIPNDGIAVAGDLPDELKQGIADALIAYGQTEEGAEVLDSIYEISEFVVADQASFDAVREAIDALGLTGD
jgi:phosphonate transport system substrate-binding protein